jgi:hypothetical protein
MARGIRVEYPGAFYHVMARGNRRERIFREDGDRGFFCQTLGEVRRHRMKNPKLPVKLKAYLRAVKIC